MHCTKDLYQAGNCFHFYNRAVDGEFLFLDDEDYFLFLEKFSYAIEKYPTSVLAYCLMPNHFHFFLKQNSDNAIYQIFNSTLSSYIQKYNLKYSRKGALMASPLQSIFVDDDRYFLNLCQYIHLNPVKAKMVYSAEEWEYSNYREWIGIRESKLFDANVYKLFNISPDQYKIDTENNRDKEYEKQFQKILYDNPR